MLSHKSFLITGGTGSFGRTLIEKLIETDIAEIVIFSRDEAKQHFMKQEYTDERLRFALGDVRNLHSVSRVLSGVDYVFHAAALKHVPASEQYPWEFFQTNVEGSNNLLTALAPSLVSKAIFLSTDKAVYPLNAMGMSKAMMEKLVRSEMHRMNCVNTVTRYGNVIGSRGSVIPQFIESIRKHNRVLITAPEMTRFMMSLEDSVDLVLFALENGKPGDLFVQKSPAATVQTIVDALSLILEPKNLEVIVAGVRPGEKHHETLLTAEERMLATEHEKYFQASNLNGRDKIENFSPAIAAQDYTSANTSLLNAEELAQMLLSIPQITEILATTTQRRG